MQQSVKNNLPNKFENIFAGREDGFGFLDKRLHKDGIKPNGKKDAKSKEDEPINFETHLNGTFTQGHSPINRAKGGVRYLVIDFDKFIDWKIITKAIWKISSELTCVMSLSGRWHIYYHFDKWTSVEVAKKARNRLIEKIRKLPFVEEKDVDEDHSLPGDVADQYWCFLPYSKEIQKCYTTWGETLSKEQYEYRYKFRKHPLIVASIGQVEGRRHKALFNVGVYLKHNELDTDLYELNKHFNPPLPDGRIDPKNPDEEVDPREDEIQHQLDSAGKDKYDEAHLKRNLPSWIDNLSGVKHFAEKKEVDLPEDLPDALLDPKAYEDYAFNNEPGTKKKERDPSAWRHGILGHDLDKKELKPIEWVVEGLITPGLNLIAGKSKIGKSFLAYDLSYQVQIGGTWLGHKCTKGKVIHYSLEDLERRTKKRWKDMGIKPLETNYQFRDRQPKIPLLTLGLEEEIEDWIKNTLDAKLVIIDPYQKVKYTKGGYKLNAYENDNYNLQDLQTLATKYEIAIVLVHHLKKVRADDVYDEITGSAGIQSNSDSMIVISSDRKKGKNPILSCLPKDAEQQEFEIALNPKCIWENLGKPGMAALTKIQSAIIKIMKDDEERTPMEIIVKVQEDNKEDNWGDEHIRKEITRLVEKSHLFKTKRGHYKQVPF
tara:strand:+ start:3185 stop:5155 length:1971 start_codon:yes stop_codon:yes gene_type:complete